MSSILQVPAVGHNPTIQIEVRGDCSQRVLDAFDGTLTHAAEQQLTRLTPSKNPHKTWTKQEKIAYADCITQYNLTAAMAGDRANHAGGRSASPAKWATGLLILSWAQAAGAQVTASLLTPNSGTHGNAPTALRDAIAGDLETFRALLVGWAPTAINAAFNAVGGPREALQGIGLSDVQIESIGNAFVTGGRAVANLLRDWALQPGDAFFNQVADAATNAGNLAGLQAAATWPAVQVAVNATQLCAGLSLRAFNGCIRVFTPESLINAGTTLVTWAQGNLTTTDQTAGLAYQTVGTAGYPVLNGTWDAELFIRNDNPGGPGGDDGAGYDWKTILGIGAGVVGGILVVVGGTCCIMSKRKARRAAALALPQHNPAAVDGDENL